MRRVVITGIGIVSCLGNNKAEVLDSLKNGRSGIRFNEEYAELGMRSHVSGSVQLDTAELIDRKLFRFMGGILPPLPILQCRKQLKMRH